VKKKSQNCRNKGFSYCFCLMVEGSGSRRPKNTWIRWIRIRIRNTACMLNIAFLISRRSRREPVEEKKGSREPAWASSPSTSSRGQRPQFWSRPESPGDSNRQSPSLTRVKIEKTERKRSRSRSRKRSPKKKQKQRRRDRSASDTDHWASGTSLYRDEYCERDGDFADKDKLRGRKRSSFDDRESFDERRLVRVKKEKHREKRKTPSREVSHDERDRGRGRTERKERKRHSESPSDSRDWSHDREHVRVKKEKEKHKKRIRRRESPRDGSEPRKYLSPERKPVFYKVKREKKEKELVANPFAESSGSQSESLDTSRESERRRQRRRKKAKRRKGGVKQESGSSSNSSTDTERQDGAETPLHGSRIKEEKDENEMAAA
jgi:hypothetical protein